jgi:CubicO group peptidase (beta-lactamase class C family)
MPLSRRHLLLASTATPLFASCASDLWRYRGESLPGLAASLGVCAATFCTLKAGSPQPAAAVSGCANPGSVPADAVFQAASLTKPVVAFGALRLALAGELDLRAPVSRFLPQGYRHFRGVLRRSSGDASDHVLATTLSPMTVASLLNHTSGLPNWTSGELTAAPEPGRRWRYSGEGYVLLQAVIEAIAGTPITSFMDQQVFGPLRMHDSSFVWQDKHAGRAVHGFSASGHAREVRFPYPVAAASLYTTASDYARFLSALLADERLVSLSLAEPVPVSADLGLEWGYGWGIERSANGVNLWHWGNNPGFRAFTMVSPASKDGFVIFTNSDRGMALAVPLAQQTLSADHNAFRFSMVG